MKFNIHHGQVRFSSIQTGGKPIYRPKSPKGRLMIGRTSKGIEVDYRTDKLGNIDVNDPFHIDTMIGLGYPIYDGDGIRYPVPLDDLIYPNNNMDSTYWRRILEAKNKGETNG